MGDVVKTGGINGGILTTPPRLVSIKSAPLRTIFVPVKSGHGLFKQKMDTPGPCMHFMGGYALNARPKNSMLELRIKLQLRLSRSQASLIYFSKHKEKRHVHRSDKWLATHARYNRWNCFTSHPVSHSNTRT